MQGPCLNVRAQEPELDEEIRVEDEVMEGEGGGDDARGREGQEAELGASM